MDVLSSLGTLVGDGAEYSTIGLLELILLCKSCIDTSSLYPIPSSSNGVINSQVGTGEHGNSPKSVPGSLIRSVQTENIDTVDTCKIVVSDSTQLVIGRNVTAKANLVHVRTREQMQF